MQQEAIITMIVLLLVSWGGFALFFSIALKKEADKNKGQSEKSIRNIRRP